MTKETIYTACDSEQKIKAHHTEEKGFDFRNVLLIGEKEIYVNSI